MAYIERNKLAWVITKANKSSPTDLNSIYQRLILSVTILKLHEYNLIATHQILTGHPPNVGESDLILSHALS